MSIDPQSEYVEAECGWCGDWRDVFRDNDLCDDCDSRTVHCKICDCLVHEDDRCRHVFRDVNFEWTGSGARAPEENIKTSLFRLLDAMPDEFAPNLRSAIKAGRFHTWMVAPLIGGGGVLILHGLQNSLIYGDAILEIGERDDAEELADGYRWLASLYDDQTPEASETTLRWLDEWTEAP